MAPNTILPRLVAFANAILDIADKLPKSFAFRHLSGQLIRSGTSPALNYAEAQAAESPRDFVHKLNIALKELRETAVNLTIILQSGKIKDIDLLEKLIRENDELTAILVASIKTVKRKIANGELRTQK